MSKIIMPNYTKSLVNMMASIRKHYGLQINYNTLPALDEELSKNYKNVLIVLLDGMGSKIIENSIGNNNFFTKHKKTDYLSIFPPTTVAATTAILSTKTPLENGWLGWHEYIKDVDTDIAMFGNRGYYDANAVFDYNVPNKYMPYVSILDELKTVGIKTGDVYPAFRKNGAKDFDEFLYKIKEFINSDDSRKFCYCYWEQPDHVLHDEGCLSKEARDTIQELNDKMEKFYNEELDEDTLIIVTADHGHYDIEDLNLYGYPKILELLERLPSIEPRARTFFVKKVKDKEFVEEFNSLCKDDFILL
ncbi:MAG: alkaline phosphatase family protein [Bacilli bacterium]|nr:alkaline phosphatase family protein [Bacilli bacterium]